VRKRERESVREMYKNKEGGNLPTEFGSNRHSRTQPSCEQEKKLKGESTMEALGGKVLNTNDT